MEKSRAALSHFGGIIRLIILIVLIAIIALFAVSFIRNRQNTKTAERASQGVVSEDGGAKTDESAQDNSSNDQKADSSKDDEATLPSGVSDSDLPPTVASSSVPAAGMGTTDIALTALILTVAAFFYARNKQLSAELRQIK